MNLVEGIHDGMLCGEFCQSLCFAAMETTLGVGSRSETGCMWRSTYEENRVHEGLNDFL